MTFTLTVMTHRALGAAAARGATHNDSSSDDWTKDTEELPPPLPRRPRRARDHPGLRTDCAFVIGQRRARARARVRVFCVSGGDFFTSCARFAGRVIAYH